MTVQQETPIIGYVTNGTTTDWAFNWSSGERNENKVFIDNVEAIDGSDYNITNYSTKFGGIVEISPALASNRSITIYRETPITQETDYVIGQPFPMETHEFNLDKDTRILQELIFGNRSIGGNVNLSTGLGEDYVDILNTGGTDARIPSWDCLNPLAGAFHGEVTTVAPADGSSTAKTDGYVYFEVLP